MLTHLNYPMDYEKKAKLPKTKEDFTPRFAHHNADTCDYATETAIHIKAKEIIENAMHMIIPSVVSEYRGLKKDHPLIIEIKTRVGQAYIFFRYINNKVKMFKYNLYPISVKILEKMGYLEELLVKYDKEYEINYFTNLARVYNRLIQKIDN